MMIKCPLPLDGGLPIPYYKRVQDRPPMNQYDPSDYTVDNEGDEYLTRVVVDTCSRTFYMYSNEGDTKEIPVDTVDQFMDVLEIVRGVCDPDIVHYSDPVVVD